VKAKLHTENNVCIFLLEIVGGSEKEPVLMQKMLKVASIGLYTRSESHLSLLSTVSLMTSWDRLDQESMRRWFQLT